MELETAARKRALQSDAIKNLVVDRVFKFQLEQPLEGTGKLAIVCNRRGNWTSPTKGSQEYPILVWECYADWSRDSEGNASKDDAADRAMQLYREVDRFFHQVDREHRYWPDDDPEGGLYIIGCFRGSEPVGPADKYGVKVVRGVYHVQTFH